MLDTTANAPASLPQQAAASPYARCQALSGSRPVWCVVAAKPKAERTAHAELHRRGFTAYLPLITTRWRDRTWHTTPLFPGYLFCRIRLDQPWNPVRLCPGVFSLLSVDGIPSICPEAAVDALRASEHLRATPQPTSALWAPGMACRLATGVFSGHQGAVTQVAGICDGCEGTGWKHPDDPNGRCQKCRGSGGGQARVALLMFGQLREVAVSLDCLTSRNE